MNARFNSDPQVSTHHKQASHAHTQHACACGGAKASVDLELGLIGATPSGSTQLLEGLQVVRQACTSGANDLLSCGRSSVREHTPSVPICLSFWVFVL